jgi:protein TonB
MTKTEEKISEPPSVAPSPMIPDPKEADPDEAVLPSAVTMHPTLLPQQAFTPAPVPKHRTVTSAKIALRKSQAPSGGQKGVRQAQPDYLRNPPPVYPQQARLEHRQGVVLLMVSVSASGSPTDVSIGRSSGYEDFDQSAIRAVRNWKFRPASAGGIDISSTVGIPVNFELH